MNARQRQWLPVWLRQPGGAPWPASRVCAAQHLHCAISHDRDSMPPHDTGTHALQARRPSSSSSPALVVVRRTQEMPLIAYIRVHASCPPAFQPSLALPGPYVSRVCTTHFVPTAPSACIISPGHNHRVPDSCAVAMQRLQTRKPASANRSKRGLSPPDAVLLYRNYCCTSP